MTTRKRCPNGQHKDRKTGECVPNEKPPTPEKKMQRRTRKDRKPIESVPNEKLPSPEKKRCPKGTRKDRKTGKCIPNKKTPLPPPPPPSVKTHTPPLPPPSVKTPTPPPPPPPPTVKTPTPTPPKKPSIGFLFLTYGDPIHDAYLEKYLENKPDSIFENRVYVHPKYPNTMKNPFFKSHVIDNLIETEWGNISIVNATLELLKSAQNDGCEWFVLLSQDTYPIQSMQNLHEVLSTSTNSFFDYIDNRDGLSKTSQWWILNSVDANTIITKSDEFKRTTPIHKNTFGAADELYFLTLLKRYNSRYTFTNRKPIYTRWLKTVISKHPVLFNRLTNYDYNDINNSFFIRKTTSNFNNSPIEPKKHLVVVYIGTESHYDYSSIERMRDTDYIVISAIPLDGPNSKKWAKLLENSLYIYEIIYKFYYPTVLEILELLKKMNYWKQITFLSESFHFSNINQNIISSKIALPYRDSPRIFYKIQDNKGNPGWIYRPN